MADGQPVNRATTTRSYALTTDRLIATLHRPRGTVEAAVRGELERRRAESRIQTFVPIFVEHAARRTARELAHSRNTGTASRVEPVRTPVPPSSG